MSDVTYKIRVNRPCRLFIDDEDVMILEESKLAKINLPEGEYLRKVVAIDNSAIFDEAEIVLSGASKLENIILDTKGLDESKLRALPDGEFTVGDLKYEVTEDGNGVKVVGLTNQNLTAVVIPEKIVYGGYIYDVTNIGGCIYFDTVFYEKVRGRGAFQGCSSLTSITIPNTVMKIGNAAFLNCSSLTSLTIPNSVTSIGDCAFWGCSSLNSLTIPNSVTSIGNYAFSGCSSLNSLTIPNSVTSIGKSAFKGCSSLNSLTIPNSVTSIGHCAFSGCSSLNSLSIPNSVTSIGNYAFSGCSSLNSLTIPNSVTSIGDFAFMGCSSLNALTIPNSVTSIGNAAFHNCSSLISLTIPNSVTSIGYSAFFLCVLLIMIDYAGTKENWKKIEKGEFWSKSSDIKIIRCTDGEIKL